MWFVYLLLTVSLIYNVILWCLICALLKDNAEVINSSKKILDTNDKILKLCREYEDQIAAINAVNRKNN